MYLLEHSHSPCHRVVKCSVATHAICAGALRTYQEHMGTFQLPEEYTSESQDLRSM